jgi:hypothetical protein
MARRGGELRDLKYPALIGLVLFAAWFINQLLSAASEAIDVPAKFIVLGAIVFVLVCFISFVSYRSSKAKGARESLFVKVTSVTERHLPTLTKKRAMLVRRDDYGRPRFEKWQKELSDFISGHIQPLLSPNEDSALQQNMKGVWSAIERSVLDETGRNPVFQTFSEDMTPNDYEHFCAAQLRFAGWTARVTAQSGDQDVDIIAEKEEVRAVFQCKLYSGPVGNKAVQEAAAGRQHERAHYALVVSNNDYTRFAKQLAATNDVILIHHTDLRNIDSILGMKR